MGAKNHTLVMDIGKNGYDYRHNNVVIASQSADWRGNLLFAQADFTGTLRNTLRLRCGLPRRFAPPNDSVGQSPDIQIRVLMSKNGLDAAER